MNVTFFLFDAQLDDRLPSGYAPEDRQRAVEAPDEVEPLAVSPAAEGCVALLFGRTADAKTVCVRAEGFLPYSFFDATPGLTEAGLCGELQAELRTTKGAEVVRAKKGTFSRLYGYDPHPDGGLRPHPYMQVFYSSLTAWRAARRKRHLAKIARLREMLERAREEERATQARHDQILRARMTGGDVDVDERALLDRLLVLRKTEIPALEERLDSYDEGDAPGGAAACDGSAVPRQAHELHVEPLTAFLQDEGVRPASWVRACGEPVDVPVSSCDIELRLVAGRGGLRQEEGDAPAPHVSLYWDIETSGLDPHEARVLQVGMVFALQGSATAPPLQRHIVSLGSVERDQRTDGVTVHECQTEEEVLETFAFLLRTKDPDFVHAYNGVNFDNPFMAKRADILGVDRLFQMSRTPMRPCALREQKLCSGGRGDNVLRYFAFAGRVNVEQFTFFTVEFTQEPSYRLDHFAKKLVNDQKIPMDYSEIVPAWEEGAGGRARIAEYCIHDCVLLHRLDEACKITLGTCVMSRTVDVLPEQVYFRGQQLRFVAQMRRRARARVAVTGHPQIMNEPREGFLVHLFGKFKGATVNDPIAGFYRSPVVVLDWASLYPSIMKAHNLSHDTIVLDADRQGREDVQRIEVSEGEAYHFVKSSAYQGILPEMLEVLQAKRGEAKREMKRQGALAKDGALPREERERAALAAVMADLLQKSIKICSNSVYGATGASNGSYPCVAISACTTAKGREAMVIKKQALPRFFPELGARVVYGDTDSIFLTFEAAGGDIQKAGAMGERVAAKLTEHFQDDLGWKGMELEHEKAFLPLHLQGKKRYFGEKYEPSPGGEVLMHYKGMDAKGVETQRRDTVPFIKETLSALMGAMMRSWDGVEAKALLEARLVELVEKRVPIEQLIQRQRLSSRATGAAARVNELREERQPGSGKQLNEWIEWVTIVPASHRGRIKDVNATELAECADYVRHNRVCVHYGHYLKKLQNPVLQVFEPFAHLDVPALFKRYEKIVDDVTRLNVTPLAAGDGSVASVSDLKVSAYRPPAEPPPKKRREARKKK